MKRVWTALVAAFVLCLALVGCGGKESEADNKKDFVGTWEIISMVEDGEETTEEELRAIKDFGLNVYLTLNEDGTGTIELFGENLDGNWRADKKGSGTFVLEDDDTALTLEGDTLTMTQDNSSLVFKRIDPSGKVPVGMTDTGELTYYGGNTIEDLDDAELLEVPVVDDDVCRIAIVARGLYEGDPGYLFEIENKTGRDIIVVNVEDDWTIAGEERRAILYEVIKADETLGSIGWFSADEVGTDVNALSDIGGTIFLIDATDEQTILGSYPFHID